MSIVLITGAAHGLGLEVARQLAEAGHDVVLSARDAEAAGRAAADVGARALPVGLDVTDAASVAAAAEAVGELDVLVSNAAA
jgi:NADP-dependent 3-hydroxy acid dehydrogenase YdfG